MPVLTSEDLNQIRKHKYQSVQKSLLEQLYDPIWNRIVSCMPQNLSPNIMTLTGLLSAILPCLSVLYYSHHGNLQNVGYASFFCAIGFQLWTHLDCMDGKLARRNRPEKQSPFGEILDHGGDALALLIVLTALSSIIGLDTNPLQFVIFVFVGIIMNYISEPWTIYITGALQFQSIDFVEITHMMSVVSLLSGIYGVEVWQTVILQRFNLQMRHIIFFIQVSLIPDMILGKIPALMIAKKEKGLRLSEVLSPSIPLSIIIISISVSYYFSSAEVLQDNIILFVMLFGVALIKLHLKFIVTPMINAKFNPYDRSLIPLVIFTFGVVFLQRAEMEKKLLYVVLFSTTFDAASYSFRLLYQLYHEFNDRIFILESNSHVAKMMSNGQTKK